MMLGPFMQAFRHRRDARSGRGTGASPTPPDDELRQTVDDLKQQLAELQRNLESKLISV